MEVQYDTGSEIQDDGVSTAAADQEQPGRRPARSVTFKLKQASLGELITRAASSMSISRRRDPITPFDGQRPKSMAARALTRMQSINICIMGEEGWPTIEDRFDELAVDGFLPRSRFGPCIGVREENLGEELYDALARKRGIERWMITKEELHLFWEQLTDHTFDSRIHTFFDMVDKNGDGRITKDEVQQIITLSASTSKLSKIQERADEYAAFLMEELDPHGLGYIKLHNLEIVLKAGLGQSSEVVTDGKKMNQLLDQKLVPNKDPSPLEGWFSKTSYFVEHERKRIWSLLFWLAVCSALFVWKFIEFKHHYIFHVVGYCVCIAKGGAELCKFNMALILLPMCRNTISWLRKHTKLGLILPFDDNIIFHKIVAAGIVVGIGLHAGAHLACNVPRILHASDEAYAPLKLNFGQEKPPNYWWFVKGREGWTGVLIIVLMAIAYTQAMGRTMVLPWLRRKKIQLSKSVEWLTGLNAFWYSHHLFVIVYALFIVHGYQLYLQHTWYKKTTWMYAAVPMTIYAFERLLRASYKKVQVLECSKVLPGNVLALYLSKPEGFEYTSGQYIFIKCPQISLLEWHPFSLTSAPGDDYISVHIRKSKNWTSQLLTMFPKDQTGSQRDTEIGDCKPRIRKVKIDGPYGAPAQGYKSYSVVVLVGQGIGATPFISILKDTLLSHQLMQQRRNADIENGVIIGDSQGNPTAVKKAYFYWTAREPECFEWFPEAMNLVDNRVVEVHNHCTSMYEGGDAKSALIAMLQSLHYTKNGEDILSGTKVMTHFGRPKWPEVFEHVAMNHPHQRVGVFYCGGAPELLKELQQLALRFSTTTSTKFDFHKENF